MELHTHMMVDIETMSSDKDAAVVAIGARIFTLSGPEKGFEVFIDPVRAALIGSVSDETMKWWSTQNAYLQTFSGVKDPSEGAHAFAEFINLHKPKHVWANSPSFDLVILRHLFKQTQIKWPVHYRDERDCRTLFALGRELGVETGDIWTAPGRMSHNALDDATTQAQVTIRILQHLYENQRLRNRVSDSDLDFDLRPRVLVLAAPESSSTEASPDTKSEHQDSLR